MSDDFFNQFDKPKPPRSEFSAALYQRITQPMKPNTRPRVLRSVALSFAMVAVIAAVLFFLPSTHAFADAIVQQFKKGNVTIQTTNDAASASQLAGFTVLAPAYVPDGFTAYNPPGVWNVSHSSDGVMASIFYNNQPGDGHISIDERMGHPGEPNILTDLPEKQDVTVRGQPGTWSPNNGKNFLVWNENGITFSIVSSLTKDDALKVAESLGK